jgi:hypothetical protein
MYIFGNIAGCDDFSMMLQSYSHHLKWIQDEGITYLKPKVYHSLIFRCYAFCDV